MTSTTAARRSHHLHRDFDDEACARDAYRARTRPPEPAWCPDCGAVFHDGRWCWGERRAGARPHLCAACLRIAERHPAGYVTLSGAYFSEHRDELVNLIHNEEARERADHPLQRIMAIETAGNATTVTTTDAHLARRLGEALYHACHGELQVRYSPDEYLVRVTWIR